MSANPGAFTIALNSVLTPVMTLKQAAAYLQISKAHLSNVINGKVPEVQPLRCFRVGRRILIKREWVDEWMESADLEAIR